MGHAKSTNADINQRADKTNKPPVILVCLAEHASMAQATKPDGPRRGPSLHTFAV